MDKVTESHDRSINQQRINSNRITALERTAAKATGGLNAFTGTESSVVEAKKISSRGEFQTIAMYHHRETI